jgi:hypothetical protein
MFNISYIVLINKQMVNKISTDQILREIYLPEYYIIFYKSMLIVV